MPFDGTDYQDLSVVTKMLMEGRRRVRHGWGQGSMRQQRDSVCILGSLTITNMKSFVLTEQLLLSAIKEMGYPHTSVVAFNDDLSRTKEEILKAFDTAIALVTVE